MPNGTMPKVMYVLDGGVILVGDEVASVDFTEVTNVRVFKNGPALAMLAAAKISLGDPDFISGFMLEHADVVFHHSKVLYSCRLSPDWGKA